MGRQPRDGLAEGVRVQRMLPFPASTMTPSHWESDLSAFLRREVHVTYGRARQTPVQVQPDTEPALRVRLHRFFESASPDIVDALGRWIRAGRRARAACTRIDAWIEQRLGELPPRSPRNSPLRAAGACYDLRRLLSEVIHAHVPELADSEPAVTWGQRGRSRGVNSLDLGTFDHQSHLVRLHPVLDHAAVPEFFVRFVLFHELLHAAIPSLTTASGRHQHHPPGFRERERSHPDYRQALAWEEHHLPELIARARRGCFESHQS